MSPTIDYLGGRDAPLPENALDGHDEAVPQVPHGHQARGSELRREECGG